MALEFPTQADVPESMRNDFSEFERDGKKVWIPTGEADALKTQFRMQGDLTSQSEATKTLQSQMTELTNASAQKDLDLETEKERIRQSSLSADERTQETLDYLKNQIAEQKDTFDGEVKRLTSEANQKTVDATVAELAAAATPSNQKILQRMIQNDIEVKADGSLIILDENGKATSLTLGEYKDSLPERYPTLTTAVQSEGGDGKGNSGETVDVGGKKYSDLKTPAEKAAYLKKKHKR